MTASETGVNRRSRGRAFDPQRTGHINEPALVRPVTPRVSWVSAPSTRLGEMLTNERCPAHHLRDRALADQWQRSGRFRVWNPRGPPTAQ